MNDQVSETERPRPRRYRFGPAVPVLIWTGLAWLLVNLIGSAWPPDLTQRNFTASMSNDLTSTAASLPTTTAPSKDSPILRFNGHKAYEQVLAQSEIGPRPTGSAAGWSTGNFIIAELRKTGWPVEIQPFVFKGIKGRNIIGKRGSGPLIILGAHYDTRPAADRDPNPALRVRWIEGANDGASGVAVLLELARVLELGKLSHEVWLVFLDAEDRGSLDGWPFAVGARHLVKTLSLQPQGVVIVDMVGDSDQNIFFESNSTTSLRQEIWSVAAELGHEAYLIPKVKYTIIDDHIPFIERGLTAVAIIDFDYPFWHMLNDTADKVSPQSLERVGSTLEVWLEKDQ